MSSVSVVIPATYFTIVKLNVIHCRGFISVVPQSQRRRVAMLNVGVPIQSGFFLSYPCLLSTYREHVVRCLYDEHLRHELNNHTVHTRL